MSIITSKRAAGSCQVFFPTRRTGKRDKPRKHAKKKQVRAFAHLLRLIFGKDGPVHSRVILYFRSRIQRANNSLPVLV